MNEEWIEAISKMAIEQAELSKNLNESIMCLGEQTRLFQLWCNDLEKRIDTLEALNNKVCPYYHPPKGGGKDE